MLAKFSLRVWLIFAAALLGFSSGIGALPASDDPKPVALSGKDLWLKGADQVLSGKFLEALSTLEQANKLDPQRPEISSSLTWLREARDLAESRERLRVRNYDHYVAEALKAAKEAKEGATSKPADSKAATTQPEKKKPGAAASRESAEEEGAASDALGELDENDPTYKWGTALRYAQAAMSVAKDQEEFRAQPWLQEMVDNVLLEIERHKKADHWRDALVLYDILRELYPDHPEYEDGYNLCRKHAHLEFIYGPKSTWQADLRGVTPGVVKEIIGRIDSDYVEDVKFKDLCLDGLDQLATLAKTKSLNESFPSLADQDLVDHFVARLQGLIKKYRKDDSTFRPRDAVSAFNQALKINEDSLRLPEGVMVDEFVSGMIDKLDEFTGVIWPAEVDEFNKHTRGEFVGVGIQITKPEGQPIRVESPLENTPACKAGIKPGDQITHIDGKSTLDVTVVQAVRLITGEPGTTVTLTVKDPLINESRDVVLKREKIEIRTVAGDKRDESKPAGWDYMVDPDNKIGYVRVSGFMDKTVADLKAALKQLRTEECRGLILDLRDNPGGLLTSARDMCELFLGADDPIVKTKGRNRAQNTEIHARSRDNFGDWPLIVLVNEFSASASEIVAGALAGKRSACVVGERSFGKGSVQNLIPVADGQAYLKLTTAYYYIYDMDLPGSDPWFCLHKRPAAKVWGVEPHVNVKVIPQEMMKIRRLRRERDVLKGKDQAEVPREILERSITTQPNPHLQEDENPNTDPQIVAAVDLMRIKLLSRQPWVLAPRMERTLIQAKAEKTKIPQSVTTEGR